MISNSDNFLFSDKLLILTSFASSSRKVKVDGNILLMSSISFFELGNEGKLL